MTGKTGSCACGQLTVTVTAPPVRVSICHCRDCQRRTGSVFSTNARFAEAAVSVTGQSRLYRRKGDSGGDLEFHFCPACGTTLYWRLSSVPGVVAVAAGAFADADFGPPALSVYEARKHHWVSLDHIEGLTRVR